MALDHARHVAGDASSRRCALERVVDLVGPLGASGIDGGRHCLGVVRQHVEVRRVAGVAGVQRAWRSVRGRCGSASRHSSRRRAGCRCPASWQATTRQAPRHRCRGSDRSRREVILRCRPTECDAAASSPRRSRRPCHHTLRRHRHPYRRARSARSRPSCGRGRTSRRYRRGCRRAGRENPHGTGGTRSRRGR